MRVTTTTMHYMSAYPTSVRLSDAVKQRLEAHAARTQETPSALAVRLIDEGLRVARHPGIAFHDSPAHGRVASLVQGPDVAEVIDVLSGLEAAGEQRLVETAGWFGIHPAQVRIAVGYYTEFPDGIDQQMAQRHREAAEARGRYEAEQALLG